jgi:Uma2 family endonuclease
VQRRSAACHPQGLIAGRMLGAADLCYLPRMAGEAAARLPTFVELYARIEQLPPGLTGEILSPGVLRVMSRPSRAHRLAHKQLARVLGPFDADSGGTGWWIELEAEIRFGERLLVPDLAGWRVERFEEPLTESPITAVPDWACEILSPSTGRDDRRLKLPTYAREGVRHVWLVEPEARLIEVFETREGRAVQLTSGVDEEVLELPPFVGATLDLAQLWAPRKA